MICYVYFYFKYSIGNYKFKMFDVYDLKSIKVICTNFKYIQIKGLRNIL